MIKQEKRRNTMRRYTAVLTAAALAVAWAPISSVDAVTNPSLQESTPFVFRSNNQYLSVAGGEAGDGVSVVFYDADGAAYYNGWFLSYNDGDSGFSIYSALDDSYYLSEEDGNLYLSQSAQSFYLSEDGVLSNEDGSFTISIVLEAVSGCISGDMNQDGSVNCFDLTILRMLLQTDSADFVEASVGNVNGDGLFSGADAAHLQAFLLGEDVTMAEVSIPGCTIVPESQVSIDTETMTTETTTETVTTTSSRTKPSTTSNTITETTTETTDFTTETTTVTEVTTTMETVEQLTVDDMPTEYVEAMEWIWENRIEAEASTARWNLIFDQIIAGEGELHYVVRWQSYKTLTLEQRQQMEVMLEDAINAWTDWLVGYDDWSYDHVDVKIVGWAVLDETCLEDLQDDEVVYTDTEYYDSSGDTSNGTEEIPSLLPSAPSELWRFEHFTDSSYEYPGTRFDMYLWATQGWPSIGGCGGDWEQRLSGDAYLNILESDSNVHVLIHEIGHGFGLTDFYGENGASDGPPPDGFSDDGTSIMMAGSSTGITNFDGWMLRYVWSQIKDEEGRF